MTGRESKSKSSVNAGVKNFRPNRMPAPSNSYVVCEIWVVRDQGNRGKTILSSQRWDKSKERDAQGELPHIVVTYSKQPSNHHPNLLPGSLVARRNWRPESWRCNSDFILNCASV